MKGLLATAGLAATGFRLALANAPDYRGRLLVTLQADGGWDPTSFCDPKVNTPGEPVINHWAERDEIRQTGNIAYAPFAKNVPFFEKYHDRMLVINGVDAQTNSHTVGIVHNWSGRNSEGFPTVSAMLAAHHAPDLALPYLSFGGFSETAGLTRFTRVSDPGLLRSIAFPELGRWGGRYFTESEWDLLQSYRTDNAGYLAAATGILPAAARNRGLYRSSLASTEGLKSFADAIPPEDQLERAREFTGPDGNVENDGGLRRQAQIAVLAFKTGVAVSADLFIGGFDTHSMNDPYQGWVLGALTDSVDYLWDYAEEHGVADRMVVVMGSDFGRTNFYNADDGKDHWPIGSFVIMGEEPAVDEPDGWRNRRPALRAKDQPPDARAG